MKRCWYILGAALIIGQVTACATITTRKVTDLNSEPEGIRVYPPRIYLFVGATESHVFALPDVSRAYDVKPLTILAKQDFKIDMDDGQLKDVQANQDTTAIIDLIKSAAQMAAKGAGLTVASQVLGGTYGLPQGLFMLDDSGVFRRVKVGP